VLGVCVISNKTISCESSVNALVYFHSGVGVQQASERQNAKNKIESDVGQEHSHPDTRERS
jgi:hypothetical protein